MEAFILSNWKAIYPNMFKQNGNLNIFVLFLSLKNNKEYAYLKPTLNRWGHLDIPTCNSPTTR